MRILIIGGDSSIAQILTEYLEKAGHQLIKTTRRTNLDNAIKLDLANAKAVENFTIPEVETCIVLASITSMAQCNENEQATRLINVTHTCTLLDKLHQQDIYSLYLSSNQVFHPQSTANSISTATNPNNNYGRMKRDVEKHIEQYCPDAGVLRLGKVIGNYFPLIDSFIEQLKKQQTVSAYDNYAIAPISMSLCCQIISALIEDKMKGLFQASGSNSISYFDLVKLIASNLQLDTRLIQAEKMQDDGKITACNQPVMVSNIIKLIGASREDLSIENSLSDLLPSLYR
jgi:dTDP-4-dehydrorhamnose reductase